MNDLSDLLKNVTIPDMFPVKQIFDRTCLSRQDIRKEILDHLFTIEKSLHIDPDMRIAITAGSRGIQNMDLIIKTIVEYLKSKHAYPFIVPAMGSHGGATAEGQKNLLAGYGITEDFCGCPVLSSMETVEIGTAENGKAVYLDRFAAESDGIVVACRIKPHTAFRGPYESGILKMMAIGLGKQKGAESCHKDGFGKMAENIQIFGKAILDHAPILFSVATIENAFDETKKIIVLKKEEILSKEPSLLIEAKESMARIYLPSCDVLIVDEIGKNFSGEGMDPNITGTFLTPFADGGVRAKKVIVLNISDLAHGNGFGIGSAEATTRRAFEKLDLKSMYVNGLTSTVLAGAKIPCIFESDKLAIKAVLKTLTDVVPEKAKIIRISNTLDLEKILISKAYENELSLYPQLEKIGGCHPLSFSDEGNLDLLVKSKP